jgi:small-conductance mechanosensitive channel
MRTIFHESLIGYILEVIIVLAVGITAAVYSLRLLKVPIGKKERSSTEKIKTFSARILIFALALSALSLFPSKSQLHLLAVIFCSIFLTWAITDLFIELFFRRFLISSLRVGIPDILIGVAKTLIILIALVIIFHQYTGIKLTPILTESAILSVIIGLAFQDTLGNFISGLALHFSSPYRIGDWIKSGGIEGKINRMDWRATTLLTRTNDSIVIPHSTMAKNDVYNFSSPSSRHIRELKIPFSMNTSPDKIYRILISSAAEVEGVLKDSPPSVSIAEFGNDIIIYSLQVWIEDFDRLPDIMGNLSRKIWYKIRREGIPLGIEGLAGLTSHAKIEKPIAFLKSLPLLSSLDEKALENFIEQGDMKLYGNKEIIIKEGENSQDFFILIQGKAAVSKNEFIFYTYKPGEFFGEMALITGEPRKATIQALEEASVLVFKKEELAPFLDTHPKFLELLSNAIANRLKTLPQEELEALETKEEQESQTPGLLILKRIKSFFLGEK